MPENKTYDVIVVGAGASGGTLAAHLAQAGVDVCIVEGGPKINTRTDFNTHALPFHFENRGIPTMKPGKQGFDSERSRGVGGKSLTWNAVAWRFGPRDFKGRTFEGAGEDWPVDYAEMAPWYSRIEREIGVCGNRDGLEDLPDGEFLPPIPMKCTDVAVMKGAAKLGVKVIHVRKATLSRPMNGRPACHFCGNCMAGCDVVAKYNSADVHLAPALETGKLTILPNAVVREVTVNPADNRVTGVNYVDRESMKEGQVLGRVVVVSCACVQSVALLQMSTSRLYPHGLANSSGHLGKHFIPHFTNGVQCFMSEFVGKASVNDEGFLDHAYVPSFMHSRKRDYARSFGVQFNYQNRRAVGWARSVPGFGASYKQAVKERYPAFLTFSPYGEMLPNKSNVDLDTSQKDAYGLPRARRNVVYSENDRKIFRDMTEWSVRILKSAGAEILAVGDEPRTNHELGGARMGDDPKTSIVNRWCQSHDVKNLFVVDGSVFPSASEKNPTHTMMALAARSADYIASQLKKREL